MLKIIAAVAENGVIGRNEEIPWRLPDDMKWFKEHTSNMPVVMGRKTYESLPERFRPLPGRENIVLTRHPESLGNDVTVLDNFQKVIERSKGEDIWVIGGAEIYELALPIADEIYLTRVHTIVGGDTFFPNWDRWEWKLVSRSYRPIDERHEHDFTWEVLRRKTQPAS